MYRRILLLCDLEGVNRVVGEPYHGLGRGTEEWEIARRQAAKELNAAADALYETTTAAGGISRKATSTRGSKPSTRRDPA